MACVKLSVFLGSVLARPVRCSKFCCQRLVHRARSLAVEPWIRVSLVPVGGLGRPRPSAIAGQLVFTRSCASTSCSTSAGEPLPNTVVRRGPRSAFLRAHTRFHSACVQRGNFQGFSHGAVKRASTCTSSSSKERNAGLFSDIETYCTHVLFRASIWRPSCPTSSP